MSGRRAVARVAESDVVERIGPDGTTHGPLDRRAAHAPPGVLHRAVSLQVVDPAGRWLLQRRAPRKDQFAGRWTNTCCTHPWPGEAGRAAAVRRAAEELGLVVDDLRACGSFVYRAVDARSGLVEHERDEVFVAVVDTTLVGADPEEISAMTRLGYDDALALVSSGAGTPWAAAVLRRCRLALLGD